MNKITTQDTILIDDFGRERIFYGINICDKGSYDENTKRRNYSYQLSDEVLENCKKQGYNIIRLGITWDAVEPEKGKYNEEYINSVKTTLDKCYKYGLYAYIDMHQDLYSGWGNGPGDGAPDWACHSDKYKYRNPKFVWAEGYFIDKAVHRAFDNFWDNKYGVQDAYIKMWVHLAEKLNGHPALFGYDIMNEPFLGKDGGKVFRKLIASAVTVSLTDKRIGKIQLIKDAFTKGNIIHALDQYNGDVFGKIVNKTTEIVNRFDSERYMPFLDKASEKVREVSPDPIIFIENSYYSNLGIKCAVRQIKNNGKAIENQIFAPHAYDLMVDTPEYKYASNSRVKSIFDQRRKEQHQNLKTPVIVGEWGGHSEGTEWLHHIEFLLNLFDSYKWSSTYWTYFDGLIGTPMWDVLKKPYPRAVTGKIENYCFDRDNNTFTLSFSQDKKFDVPTEIFIHKEIEKVETDGSYEIECIDENAYILKLSTDIGKHTVSIKFKGEGFSYTKIKNDIQ